MIDFGLSDVFVTPQGKVAFRFRCGCGLVSVPPSMAGSVSRLWYCPVHWNIIAYDPVERDLQPSSAV